MKKLVWDNAAKTDLLTIIDFISDDNCDAAQALNDDIQAKASQLPTYPHMGKKGRVDGTFEKIVHPHYILIYTVNDTEVRIIRLLHTSQQFP